MAFSVWEYLRERARNATLAGIQDALDIAEEGDFEGVQKLAAGRLTARLGGQVVRQLPEAVNVATGPPAPEPGPESPGKVAPPPVAQARAFGQGLEPTRAPTKAPAPVPDPFEERLNAARPLPAPQERRGPSRNGQPPPDPEFTTQPPGPEAPERRKRGRPRKDGGSDAGGKK